MNKATAHQLTLLPAYVGESSPVKARTVAPTLPKPSSRIASRRLHAKQSFGTAADCIGPCPAGMSLFAITRGQFSMIDAVMHVLSEAGPSNLSLWTWTIGEYDVDVLIRQLKEKNVTGGRLIIDTSERTKRASNILNDWKKAFGPQSIRFVVNHAKMATVESATGLRFLLRGSMNLNRNSRFEQLDITEGGPDFDLVREVEEELPVLDEKCSFGAVYDATGLSTGFRDDTLRTFQGPKKWAK